MRNVTIQITFISFGQRVSRGGTFPLKGRTPVKVLEDWINEIKREMDFEQVLTLVIDGEEVEV